MLINVAILAGLSGMPMSCGNEEADAVDARSEGHGEGKKGGKMVKASAVGHDFKERLLLRYSPVGLFFTDKKPEGAGGFKRSGAGCIMPLLLASARGMTVAFDEKSAGRPCAAFFLGYRDSIFPGIEYFLSHGPLVGSVCERFVKSPRLAREILKQAKQRVKTKGAIVFKPLEQFSASEKPEAVIFFAEPDQLSALVYLLYFDAKPGEERVTTRFASGCGAAVTWPLALARRGERKAVWGLHDIAARSTMPMEIMSFALPYDLLVRMWKNIGESFLITESWKKIARRIEKSRGARRVKK